MRKVSPYRAPDVDRDLFHEAWNLSRRRHGDQVTFYLPGMIRYGNLRGLPGTIAYGRRM
jgi:hypothetical protein